MFHLPSRRKGAGLRPVALCAGAFALAFGAQVSWAQSSSFERNMRVLEAVGTMFEQMGRDTQRSALEEEQRTYEAQQAEQRRAQEAQRRERDETALLDRARSDPALNPFGAKRAPTATAAARSGAKPDGAQSAPAIPSLLPVASAASPASRPACTDEAVTPLFEAIVARMPKTQGMCDAGRAGKKAFGEMLGLIAHCPDTGVWAQAKQDLRNQLRSAEELERNTCG